MSPTKRALLIASPYGDLQGPENDVDMMAKVLEKRGFQLNRCCREQATREGIRSAWQQLISETSTDDIVVVYYSGHGGEALSAKEAGRKDNGQPWRLQFIVPMDYDQKPGDFSGISEAELSQLLLDTTNRTQNVTVILDCCHSGRMVRDPRSGRKAIRKNLPTTNYHDISRHIEELRQMGKLRRRTTLESNPHAVRIAAAAPWESAYEYENEFGERVGALTEALARAIEEANDDHVSWKTMMLRVQELVNVPFPQQHPRVEGPHSRFMFSLDHRDSGAFLIRGESDNTARIQAGRVAGVRKNNTYAIMPPGSEYFDAQQQVATATVMNVSGFNALATLSWKSGTSRLPPEGALAFLVEESLFRWPVSVPEGLVTLQTQVEQSRFIECCDEGKTSPLLEFRQQEGKLTLSNQRGVLMFSQRFYGKEPSAQAYKAAVSVADNVARARHFLTQTCDIPEEQFQHDVEIKLRLMRNDNSERVIEVTGEDSIPENSEIFISLYNHDQHASASVSVFEVEENGQINAISTDPDGIDLPPGRDYTICESEGGRKGLAVKWPYNISRAQAVVETLVFVISSAPVNLQFLASPELAARGVTKNQPSLDHRLYRLAQGIGRRIEPQKRAAQIQYNIVQLLFFLEPSGSSQSKYSLLD
jgi:hypothetical protein